MNPTETYSAFAGTRRLVRGSREEMLRAVKRHVDGDPQAMVLIFEDRTGRQVDFDLRGTEDEVVERAAAAAPPTEPERVGPGRPKLGVVSREVSLLPRHWEWLQRQPQGASAALRRLVDEARKREPDAEAARQARAALSHFLWVMAGDLPGFEEATRALFANDVEGFRQRIRPWPADLRRHLDELLREGGALPVPKAPRG